MTIQFQLLNAYINKSIEGYAKRVCEIQLHLEKHPISAFGKIKKASASKIVECIYVAQKTISSETAIHSFEKGYFNNCIVQHRRIVNYNISPNTKSNYKCMMNNTHMFEIATILMGKFK